MNIVGASASQYLDIFSILYDANATDATSPWPYVQDPDWASNFTSFAADTSDGGEYLTRGEVDALLDPLPVTVVDGVVGEVDANATLALLTRFNNTVAVALGATPATADVIDTTALDAWKVEAEASTAAANALGYETVLDQFAVSIQHWQAERARATLTDISRPEYLENCVDGLVSAFNPTPSPLVAFGSCLLGFGSSPLFSGVSSTARVRD
jgi:hypothetical protein